MAATLTATPEPSTVSGDGRPRVRLEITATEPMSSVIILRDGVPLREQPVVSGLSTSYIYDYEAPFGQSVNYTMEGEYAGGWEQVFTEDWADLTGWDVVKTPIAVSGGRLVTPGETSAGGEVITTGTAFTSSTPDFVIEVRNITGLTGSGDDGIFFTWGGVNITMFWEGIYLNVYGKAGYDSPLPQSVSLLRISFRGNSILVEVEGRQPFTSQFPNFTWPGPGPRRLSAGVFGAGRMGSITVYGNPLVGGPFSGAVYGVVLDEPGAWLIHPSDSNLSVQLDDGTFTCEDISIDPITADEVGRPASRTVFGPGGRRESVIYPHGQRKYGVWDLVLNTQTLDARNRLGWATLDQFPLMLRVNPDLGYDLPDGWYSVGDITEKRISENLQYPGRQVTLPMERTAQPPAAIIPSYSWGDAYVSGVTWGALSQNTWFDVYMGDVT